VACSYKHRVRWSGLKCRGLIPAPVIAVNALRSRAVPDNSLPAGNGERRPPWRSLAPIRPPLFLSHAMKGDGVFQPSQGTARPEGDNASRSRHRHRAKAAHTSNGHRPGIRAGTGQEMETRHRAGDAPQGRRRATGPETPVVPAAAPSPGARRADRGTLTPAAFRRATLTPPTASVRTTSDPTRLGHRAGPAPDLAPLPKDRPDKTPSKMAPISLAADPGLSLTHGRRLENRQYLTGARPPEGDSSSRHCSMATTKLIWHLRAGWC
jgi:hypothetical protein